MTAPFGLNILAQYVRDRAALLGWLSAAQPAAVVCMDDHNLTQQIKKALPDSTVIHRAYNPNDAHWWDAVTPQEWVNAHLPYAANGVVLQTLNEPVLNDAALTWLEQVAALCPHDMRLALPNFAVGNPHEDDILAGKYDRLLRLVCGTRHILALHEYFIDDPAAEQPWLCGRFRYWGRRARVLGLPEPRIVITEHGRDIGGGKNDGWRGTGWSEQAYCQRLVDAQEAVYDNAMPVCIFCWGTGAADHWLSFDIQDAPTLQKALIAWNKTHPITEKPPVSNLTPLGQYRLIDIPADWVNVRQLPNTSGADLGNLYVGDVVTLFSPVVNGWQYTEQDALKGWVSLQNDAVVFAPVLTPAPSPYTSGVDVSSAQVMVSWDTVKNAGYTFAFARATQGVVSSRPVGADTRFRTHMDSALLAGMNMGVYHAFIASVNGKAQAEFYYTAIAPYLDRLRYPPAIDVELTNGQSPPAIADRLREMALALEVLIGQKPMIYTAPGWWNSYVGRQHDAYFATLPLWVAHWTAAPKPILPRPWVGKDWLVWQYQVDENGIPGYPGRIDVNRTRS